MKIGVTYKIELFSHLSDNVLCDHQKLDEEFESIEDAEAYLTGLIGDEDGYSIIEVTERLVKRGKLLKNKTQ